MRFDDRSLATVLADVRRIADPLARALCWAALWDACRDAELPAAAFVRAVLDGVDGEPDPAVVATLLGQARTAATLYATDGLPLLGAARRGESAGGPARPRPAATCSSPASAPSPPPPAAPRRPAVLTGRGSPARDVPAGLVVDTELRWHLVECLAALGALAEGEIDAEQARDDTAAGRLHALTARAALPTPQAKARAWEQVTGDSSLSNHETGAVAGGFWRVGQDELLRPYVDRYVAELPALWDARTPQVAGTLARELFPSTLVEQDVHDRTAVLERDDHPAGLRRYVAEQRDDLRRALAARALA